MKKIIVLSILFGGFLSLVSCNDNLDLKSSGSITMDEVFTDRNRTRGYLNSCYSYLPGSALNAASWTDDAQDSEDVVASSVFDIWYHGGITASNFASYAFQGNPWTSFYQGIRKCNVFIASIDDATAYATESEKIGWKAQAKVLRAFYYFELFRRYGNVPLILEERSTTYDYSQDKKASTKEIVDQILKDCDEALATEESTDFPWGLQDNQFGMMTRATAYFLKAEAITYALSPLFDDGSYTLSYGLEITSEALKQCLTHDYGLFLEWSDDYSIYGNYFLYNPDDLRAKDKETIFGGSRVSAWSDAGLSTTDGMTKAGPCPTQELVDCFEMADGTVPITGYSDNDHLKPIINSSSTYDESNPYANRDPRFYNTIFYNGSSRGSKVVYTYEGADNGISSTDKKKTRTGYYMRKYAHNNSTKNSNSDGYVRYFRIPELAYNFAEIAYQAVGPDSKAVTIEGVGYSACDIINLVRARALMPGIPSGLSKSDFEKRYRNERRVEFAMEYQRYFDVRRWKILDETKVVTGMKITQNGDGSFNYTRFRFDDRASTGDKFLLNPIDVTEASKMEKLTGDTWQNPGWE